MSTMNTMNTILTILMILTTLTTDAKYGSARWGFWRARRADAGTAVPHKRPLRAGGQTDVYLQPQSPGFVEFTVEPELPRSLRLESLSGVVTGVVAEPGKETFTITAKQAVTMAGRQHDANDRVGR